MTPSGGDEIMKIAAVFCHGNIWQRVGTAIAKSRTLALIQGIRAVNIIQVCVTDRSTFNWYNLQATYKKPICLLRDVPLIQQKTDKKYSWQRTGFYR